MTDETDTDMSDPEDRRAHFRAIDGDAPDAPAEGAAPEPPAANDEAVRMRLRGLEQEHRDLDAAISTMEERMPYDRLTIQRLKKRKLALKDQMTELRETILPDIIA